MDLSEKIECITKENKESDIKMRRLIELSAEKHHLQRELRDLEMNISVKGDDLMKLRKGNIVLSTQVEVLEKCRDVVVKELKRAVREAVVKEEETAELQKYFWDKINTFVDKANGYSEDNLLTRKNIQDKKADMRRETELNQLKLQGKLDAVRMFELHQKQRIQELMEIKELLKRKTPFEIP